MYKTNLDFAADINPIFSYALYQNRIALVRSISIKNNSEEDIENLSVRVSSEMDLFDPHIETIELLHPGEERCMRNIGLNIHGSYLLALTERLTTSLTIELKQKGETINTISQEFVVLAYDEWPGLRYYPDLLVAFVTPNHPKVKEIVKHASVQLGKWIGSGTLDGYQSGDPNKVLSMAAAAYTAIQQLHISYITPPPSYEDMGQRVRLVDELLSNKMGTCMDMTLLYVACLEAMGLNPLLIHVNKHIFAGVWLTDETFSDPTMDDPSQLEKRMAEGVSEIALIECTAMCQGGPDFDISRKAAGNEIKNHQSFEFVVDVTRARRSGVRPLPMFVERKDSETLASTDGNQREKALPPTLDIDVIELEDSAEKENPISKQVQWERKLLDLSMRNQLLNLRIRNFGIPLLASNLSHLEDALSDNTEFSLLGRPLEWSIHKIDVANTETLADLGPYEELISLEMDHHRIHSWMGEKELERSISKLYRSSKIAMEENGASTLYLAMGMLRWYENARATSEHYAPIILVPVDIIRKSASKGYYIKQRDDEARVNITLLEFLKQKFDIDISGLDPIPLDDHGIDVMKIFTIFRHAVMNQNMWDVIETSILGNFSFSQFVMWNDIHSREKELSQNKIVHALINGSIEWDTTIPDSVESDKPYLPVPVDASQIKAINMAANGVSFVLHGPPGTGKSQTITALIANALTKGMTVLFVAEKMAALEVVQKRLAALGIDNFCLELHSNKTIKKNVLNQLKQAVELRVWGMSTDYDKKIDDIAQMRGNLDAYGKALYADRLCGMNFRELIDRYESIPENTPILRIDRGSIETIDDEELKKRQDLIRRLYVVGKDVDMESFDLFKEIQVKSYSQSLRNGIEDGIYDYDHAVAALKDSIENLHQDLQMDIPQTKAEWSYFIKEVKNLSEYGSHMDDNRLWATIKNDYDKAERYLESKQVFLERKAYMESHWNPYFLTQDMNTYMGQYTQAQSKLFGKKHAVEAVRNEIQKYSAFEVQADKIPVILNGIGSYQLLENNVKRAYEELPLNWKEQLNEKTTLADLQRRKEVFERLSSTKNHLTDQVEKLASDKVKDITEKAENILKNYNQVDDQERQLGHLLEIRKDFNQGAWPEAVLDYYHDIEEHLSDLRDWMDYQTVVEECSKHDLGEVVRLYEEGTPENELNAIYLKTVYRILIRSIIRQEPALDRFTGTSFNDRILQYKKAEEELLNLTKEEMFYRLSHNLPTGHESPEIMKEMAFLRRAITSGGRGISIRSLFEQIPHILTKLCPCMLMSPISVAQYLSVDTDLFDLVVFDEASQMPTCKAVGVLARGKNAVIVGDPNQMPPTSFFSSSISDEENLDMEDLDSILDDCLALGMPQTHLKWHYRSKHESLIAFSNQEYYENSMLTFPSVNDREKRVKLVTVNGTFDRKKGRINEREGQAVITELLRRYQSDELKDKSLGIVTFNIAQQGLIEDLLEAECAKDLAFDKWVHEKEEPVFVKNLENVQGDERDVILFSIGFGPDEEGKLSLNFGPLNKEGGWKRLNVAVSRAREEMLVFSSMTPEMIDLNRSKAKGVEGLKNFLEFADRGKLQIQSFSDTEKRSKGIQEAICRALQKEGYAVQKDVGHSNFRIDVAVVDPFDPNEYILGIVLDGDSYRSTENTKDREVAQLQVLENLGWTLHRIWAMDWWDNKDREIAKVLDILEEQKEFARTHIKQYDEDGPVSEKIRDLTETSTASKDHKKKQTEGLLNSSFETYDRFAPRFPHQNSKDDLKAYMENSQEK